MVEKQKKGVCVILMCDWKENTEEQLEDYSTRSGGWKRRGLMDV